MRLRLMAVVLAGFFVAAAVPALAHEHKVMGTVKAAAADHLTMKTIEGKDVMVKIDAHTKVTRDKAAIKAETLSAGTRVVVTTASDESPYLAMSIEAGPAPAESAKAKKD